MTANPWTGEESLESKGLGVGATNGVPQVDVQLETKLHEFIHQGDIHMPVRILNEFGEFSLTNTSCQNDLVHYLFVKVLHSG